jgi:hypothetical protein
MTCALLVTILLGRSGPAVADDDVSIEATMAATRFVGDLGDAEVGLGVDVQLKTLFVPIGRSRFSAHLAFDLFLAWTEHAGDQFPYQPGADLTIRGFLFLPNLCWDARATSTRLCGAIGQGTVNVNADGDRRDYGTWNYELSARQPIARGLFATVAAKYVGRVEQQVRGVDSYFSIVALRIGAGWVW